MVTLQTNHTYCLAGETIRNLKEVRLCRSSAGIHVLKPSRSNLFTVFWMGMIFTAMPTGMKALLESLTVLQCYHTSMTKSEEEKRPLLSSKNKNMGNINYMQLSAS